MAGMKTLTLADIRAVNPCYDPATEVAEEWTGTVADILRLEHVAAADRIWVVTRFLDDKTNRLFAVWCAREALKLVASTDPRAVAACDVAERFANGEATGEELAADAAARAAASRALVTTAWAAAADAADAAADAAYTAAYAASNAAYAASNAARDAAYAASNAARDAARDAQIKHLLEMVGE
jgi:hypothetical protein